MWALIENNEIEKVYQKPTAVKIGDTQYPSNFMSVWSEEELKEVGIYPVSINNLNKKSEEYYYNTNIIYSFNGDEVIGDYGEATAKHLDDWTSEDDEGNTHHYKGLKTLHSETIDNQAYSYLQPNDWYVVRNSEIGTDIPSDWSDYRADVRSTADSMKQKIEAVDSVDELEALYQYVGEPPTRPLGEWPSAPGDNGS